MTEPEDSESGLIAEIHDTAPSMEAVLQEAVEYLAHAFETQEEVDCANVVEWFAEWRERAKRALLRQKLVGSA